MQLIFYSLNFYSEMRKFNLFTVIIVYMLIGCTNAEKEFQKTQE